MGILKILKFVINDSFHDDQIYCNGQLISGRTVDGGGFNQTEQSYLRMGSANKIAGTHHILSQSFRFLGSGSLMKVGVFASAINILIAEWTLK